MGFRAGTMLLAASLGGCHSWQVQQASPSLVVEQQHPEAIQVQQTDGSRFRLTGPGIVQDTLVGARSGQTSKIPLADVKSVALRRFSTGRTALLVLGVPATFLGLLLISCASSDCNNY